jgi:predicted transcriptional regulator
MTTQMIVRIDPKLKTKVSNLAKAEGKRVSEVVRELLEDYVRDRDMASSVDDLWTRVGGKLASRGLTLKDIPRVIKEVRARK